jgi:hypothetical protein
MTLSSYMALRAFNDADMAKLIGQCTASGVRKWRCGERVPRRQFMLRIVHVTEGAVRASDFFSDREIAA